ncbi:MAG: YciI family protein [Alphaproteobacteria bacterium]|nr:YciI family protein [Alphaproteobacteria bacterium]
MLFSILIHDEPDSAALRDQHRAAHLDYLKAFDDQTLFAGPFTSDDETADLGSLRLIDFPDRAAAEQHVADEPYVIGGVQKRWQIHRWQASLPYSWRDCPRTEGNIQALFHGVDHDDAAELCNKNRDAHRAYVSDHSDQIMVRGPLLNDEGTQSVGSLWLLDVPDLHAGHTLLEGDPFYAAGLYKEVLFHRWRFGRVFDRFKV